MQLAGVGKDYRFFSLNDIRLEIPYGHIMGFIGPNGAGKSTTLRILMGLVHQDRGDVRLLGHPMPAEQAAAKWDVGFASEDMRLYDGATLDWHMRFIRSIYPSWDQAYAQTLLKRFDLRAGATHEGHVARPAGEGHAAARPGAPAAGAGPRRADDGAGPGRTA